MADHISVEPYDPAWARAYQSERETLEGGLADAGLSFEHIGSTAIPGLSAKPTIDLMVGAPKTGVDPAAVKVFEGLGYGYLGEYGIPGREFFRKGLPPTHHVHWVERGGAFWRDQILFRDFMRNHPVECAAYERLKLDLAAHFSDDRKSYTASKSSLIMALMLRARASLGARRIVVDLEATCWEDQTTVQRQEIIEIGAVALDGALGLGREFSSFVRPVKEPLFTPFCLELTGIKQEDVDAAPPYPKVFSDFTAWIGPAPFELCSWGRYDVEQFGADCARHGLPMPDTFAKHIDLRELFARRHGIPPGPLTEALKRLKMTFEGAHHRGIDDARNTARLAQILLR